MMKRIFITSIFLGIIHSADCQEKVVILSPAMFQSHQSIFLAPLDAWVFKQGNDPLWGDPELDVSDWREMNLIALSDELEDESGKVEGWFRIRIRLDSSFREMPLAISRDLWAATDIYVDGKLVHSFGNTGKTFQAYNPFLKYPIPIDLETGKEYLLALHFVHYQPALSQREYKMKPEYLEGFLNLTGPDYVERVDSELARSYIYGTLSISITLLLFFLYWLLFFLNPDQRIFSLIALLTTCTAIGVGSAYYHNFFELSYLAEQIRYLITINFQPAQVILGLIIMEWVLTKRISIISKWLLFLLLITNFMAHIFSISPPFGIVFMSMFIYYGYILYRNKQKVSGAVWAVVLAGFVPAFGALIYVTIHKYSLDLYNEYDKLINSLLFLFSPLFLLVYISIRFREILEEVSVKARKVLEITEEKRALLKNQNERLEVEVKHRTQELATSLTHLKSTQAQLIQSEKMASLGELTAGIAHEIQNPLNFVNNFSEVSNELMDEMKNELAIGNQQLAMEIAEDIKQNLEKINHHGKRADFIVKGMLQHSRTSSADKEPTDINSLCDEFLRLAYHGLRAKDKTFNVTLETDFDRSIGKININAQEIGRVVLNLFNNAFYAVQEKTKEGNSGFEPLVSVLTKRFENHIKIRVSDNGNGIPDKIRDKIFQPFFTTKPSGQGTGLGLSLSYDIVQAHGGTIELQSAENAGTTFIITLNA